MSNVMSLLFSKGALMRTVLKVKMGQMGFGVYGPVDLCTEICMQPFI